MVVDLTSPNGSPWDVLLLSDAISKGDGSSIDPRESCSLTSIVPVIKSSTIMQFDLNFPCSWHSSWLSASHETQASMNMVLSDEVANESRGSCGQAHEPLLYRNVMEWPVKLGSQQDC